jgi:heme exporter protein D
MDLGPHAVFVATAYTVTALVIATLILRALLEHRAQRRALAALEGRGGRRRSEEAPAARPRQPGLGSEATSR